MKYEVTFTYSKTEKIIVQDARNAVDAIAAAKRLSPISKDPDHYPCTETEAHPVKDG